MSEAKFTKGPWRYTKARSGRKQISSAVSSQVCMLWNCPQTEANGRLIEAAPDMHEMLKEALLELTAAITEVNKNLKSKISSTDLDEPEWWDMETCHKIQNLLAKVRGE